TVPSLSPPRGRRCGSQAAERAATGGTANLVRLPTGSHLGSQPSWSAPRGAEASLPRDVSTTGSTHSEQEQPGALAPSGAPLARARHRPHPQGGQALREAALPPG